MADENEQIMNQIMKVYYNMSDDDKSTWSKEIAKSIVDDQIAYDKQHNQAPLAYDVDHFYNTIKDLIAKGA